MKKEKVKLFFVQNKPLMYTLIITILINIAIPLFKNFNIRTIFDISNLSTDIITMLSAIFGAIVGGIFTLIGTSYSNKQQLKAKTNTKKKNLIYKPLYDELAEIHYVQLKEKPFPSRITYVKAPYKDIDLIQYTAWDRIKTDSRYIEVPNHLKESMESLYITVENYIDSQKELSKEIYSILNEVLKNQLNTKCNIVNFGNYFATYVLLDSQENIFDHIAESLTPNVDIDELTKTKVNNIFYDTCARSSIVQNVKAKHSNWMKQQQSTLELLETLIKYINIKYEE
ncbi:MAG: hypothetical protein E7523_11695 [Ruminococcaceae bacterium]|nr:hypothetical protein [Oscillospiraceae bacterium]